MTMTGPMTIVVPEGETLDFDNPEHVRLAEWVLENIQRECFDIAEKSGWHGTESLAEKILLWHSEVTEAAEELRNGRQPSEVFYTWKAGEKVVESDRFTRETSQGGKSVTVLNKPEGIASEAADVFIRVVDDSERFGIPWISVLFEKMRYNKTRSHRHGGKKF